MLNAKQIFEKQDVKVEVVDVPEWGGQVGIRIMSGKQRDEYETFMISKMDKKNKVRDSKQARAMLLVLTLCDESGNPIFTEKDLDELNKKNSKVIENLFTKASDLNGLSPESVEEIEKN